MIHDILIDGEWRPASHPAGSFSAIDPGTGKHLPDAYPISAWTDIKDALEAAARAVDGLALAGPDRVAEFLEAFAEKVDGRREELVAMAHLETALPIEPRLRSVEFPRLVDQLRQAARACRDRSWCRATIDTKLDLRSKYGPLGGPVVIFSPNNFPFAYNAAAGGDFAAALAAGNPVVAKANPGHPGTTQIFAEAAAKALGGSGLPRATFQLLYHFAPEDGLRLVSHPCVGATAFTGSRAAGMKLKEAADRAGKPISVEMSSANPVFILPGAIEERAADIARELFSSCLLGSGQMCTKPGLVVLVDDPGSEAFVGLVKDLFESSGPGILLGPRVLEGLNDASTRLARSGADLIIGGREAGGPGFTFLPTLFRLPGAGFLQNPAAFQVESFGTLSLIVLARDIAEMREIAASLEGQLTATIYSHGGGRDDAAHDAIAPFLRRKAGRLLNDRMPTGVAVSPAMNHGGPFPATGHPGFTAVGFPASMLRFAALHCYDHVRPGRLPAELRDENPTGKMWRLIDGEWTRKSL
jgi:alpha-ketoglutaric semialdehyde dehydrogenase